MHSQKPRLFFSKLYYCVWRVLAPEGIMFLMRKLLLMKLSCFLSKETDHETEQKALPRGSSHTVPVSDEERETTAATGTPGSCCPVVTWCQQSGSLCACGLYPRSCACCQQPNLEVLVQRKVVKEARSSSLRTSVTSGVWRLLPAACRRDAHRCLWTWVEVAPLPPQPVARNLGTLPLRE